MYYDLYFHYIIVVRMFFILKYYKFTSWFLFPKLINLKVYFALRKLENKDHAKIYNYLYLFKFFFGLKGYITNYKSIFALNKVYYDFDVAVFCSKQIMYYLVWFLSYELLPSAVNINTYLHQVQSLVLIFRDMNLFTEKKTSLGLFDLLDAINYQFTVNTGIISKINKPILLSDLKILTKIIFNTQYV